MDEGKNIIRCSCLCLLGLNDKDRLAVSELV